MTTLAQPKVAPLTQPDSRDVRRQLIALRVRHGASSAIGHRASNIIEMIKNNVNPARQVADLERLLNAK